MKNAISVDVEEYYHAANLEPACPPAQWHALESRVEHSTNALLDLFAETQTRATFFILGSVARRHPVLVRSILQQGHEIASHGYGHRLVYEHSRANFQRDIRKSKYILEQIAGVEVIGYRAPNFSITDRTPWAYEELTAAGYRYDSSVHPIRHPRYGNRHREITPEIITTPTGPLLELPLSVWEVGTLRLPMSGGAYWRLFPMQYLRMGMKGSALKNPLNCYLHPWEIDRDQPYFREIAPLTRLRHYGGSARLSARLREFCRTFPFVSMAEAYAAQLERSR